MTEKNEDMKEKRKSVKNWDVTNKMSEEKTKCSNPECGKEVSDNVKQYSLEHYGKILCYDCQKSAEQVEPESEVNERKAEREDVSEEDDELKDFSEKLDIEEVVDAEAVGGEEEEQKWDKTVEIDEGEFSFRGEDGGLQCKNGANDNVYLLDIVKPHCSCSDFVVNKKEQEWCKHLKAASIAYKVTKLPETPKEISEALANPEKEKTRKPPKAKKEETVSLSIMGKDVQMPVQVPGEIIRNEEAATKMIIDIIGTKPLFKDVIEKFGDIEEISADVIISLAQYSGIRFQILSKETETAKMNLGKIFKSVPMSEDKMKRYADIADFMPDTDVVVRCKITSIAVWKDKAGNMRVGTGTKEEHLTPYTLQDIVLRGANFIETKCESKSFKKAISNALPVTHDGLLQKIKATYGW